MALKHHNPLRARVDADGNQQWARAPYNFIPLPPGVVKAQTPLPHDKYFPPAEARTGVIECTLQTCAPTYIRGMLTEEQYHRFGEKKTEALTTEEKAERAPFFAMGNKSQNGFRRPVIPGSSLRGMIRNLVEIAGFGRIRWVTNEPPFFFRAVAAPNEDPLREPYKQVLGAFGKHVRAGYLKKGSRGEWMVQPAKTPKEMGWPDQAAYLKVKERIIDKKALPHLIRFDNKEYHPQFHFVSFEVETPKGKRGLHITIGDRNANYEHEGVLVCSGNMAETNAQSSKRSSHALVLEANSKAKALPISKQALLDFRNGLTAFQKEKLQPDWAGGEWGCLKVGAPIFYVVEDGEVAYFGHCPNFRIPARLFGKKRAAIPVDFVPPEMRNAPAPDLAEAIFGWVEEKEQFPKGQCAGRVFFEDAQCTSSGPNFWLEPQPITLHTLAGPKPTTFQHYLVQDQTKGHDPDQRVSLAHYGTAPGQTEIRGFKLYWHKGATPQLEASTKEREHESQLTRVVPLRPGVEFTFKIRFENLRPEELGALLWALTLPGEPGQEYRHKLGMGKPLGMGAVKIMPQLRLLDRTSRYRTLVQDNKWHEAVASGDPQTYLKAFESYVLGQLPAPKQRLQEVDRIRMLLVMLQWREQVDAAWQEKTRYMEIEAGSEAVNEYKERPVLPDPLAVVQQNFSLQQPPKERQYGKVKNFGLGQKRDFGFIQPDEGGDDLYVRKDQIQNAATLALGQRVSFKIATGEKGLRAIEVRVEK